MKTLKAQRVAVGFTVLVALLGVNSCATMKEHPTASSVGTAVVLGGASYLACKLAGGSDKQCAAIAGGVAVVSGVGTYVALRQLANRDQVAREHQYNAAVGRTGYLEHTFATPDSVAQGSQLAMRSQWSVIGPDPNEQLPYSERWEIRKQEGQTSKQIDARNGTVTQGKYESGIDFAVPSDWPPGVYVATYHLQVADKQLSDNARFGIVQKKVGGAVIRQIVPLESDTRAAT